MLAQELDIQWEEERWRWEESGHPKDPAQHQGPSLTLNPVLEKTENSSGWLQRWSHQPKVHSWRGFLQSLLAKLVPTSHHQGQCLNIRVLFKKNQNKEEECEKNKMESEAGMGESHRYYWSAAATNIGLLPASMLVVRYV